VALAALFLFLFCIPRSGVSRDLPEDAKRNVREAKKALQKNDLFGTARNLEEIMYAFPSRDEAREIAGAMGEPFLRRLIEKEGILRDYAYWVMCLAFGEKNERTDKPYETKLSAYFDLFKLYRQTGPFSRWVELVRLHLFSLGEREAITLLRKLLPELRKRNEEGKSIVIRGALTHLLYSGIHRNAVSNLEFFNLVKYEDLTERLRVAFVLSVLTGRHDRMRKIVKAAKTVRWRRAFSHDLASEHIYYQICRIRYNKHTKKVESLLDHVKEDRVR
jgi:hypothetical protein